MKHIILGLVLLMGLSASAQTYNIYHGERTVDGDAIGFTIGMEKTLDLGLIALTFNGVSLSYEVYTSTRVTGDRVDFFDTEGKSIFTVFKTGHQYEIRSTDGNSIALTLRRTVQGELTVEHIQF